MAKFNERLKYLRESLSLSQAEIAKKIGLSKSSVNMYERGEREPSIETLELIADFFNVDMDYLLGKSDHKNKNEWLSTLAVPKHNPQSISLNEQLSGIDFALWSETQDMTDAEKQDIIDYIQFRKSKRNE